MTPRHLAVRSTPHAIRVLYVIGSMGIGGAEQHLLNISRALAQRGFACEVFALDPEGPLRSRFEQAGVPVIGVRLPAWLQRCLPHPRLRARVRLSLAAPYLVWHYWHRQPHVGHFFLPAAYIIGGAAALLGPRMHRIMSRRSLNLYQAHHGLLRKLEFWLHSKMDQVCGNSQAVIRDLQSEGIDESRLRLIYNGIELDRFKTARPREQVRAELGIPASDLVFAMVANLIPYKGHADLIQAFASIRTELPENWTCLCIGRDDGIGQALRAQAEAAGIGEHLRFLGSRQDVPELLCAADVGVLCSHEEGFSNAVLEGMAAGLPMVVTGVGGNGEAVLDGSTGLVTPARQPESLGQALLRLALNPQERLAMGQRGAVRAQDTFSMKACVDQYVAMYEASQADAHLHNEEHRRKSESR